jgi:hypothetical protein
MSKRIAFLCVVTLIVAVGCGTGRYGDLRSLMGDMYDANDMFITGLEKAAGPEDVAASINKYCDKMEVLAPRIKEMKTKYPEVNFKSNNYPPELNDLKTKSVEQSQRMKGVSMKLTQYMMNQDVMKAFQRFGGVMMKMQ